MGFSDEDKILIKNLHDSEGYLWYGAKKLMKEFPEKGWSTRELSCSVMSTGDKSIAWMNNDSAVHRCLVRVRTVDF